MSANFQFSLGKMLRATAWFAVVCMAVVGLQQTLTEPLIRDVYRTRMVAYMVLALIGGILAVATIAGEERAGYLLAFWILVLLAGTLAYFIFAHGGHQRLRLKMPEEEPARDARMEDLRAPT